jgi:hypothetical protein
MSSEQIVLSMYWVKELYIGLMKRSKVKTKPTNVINLDRSENGEKQEKGDDDDEVEEEEKTIEQPTPTPLETLKFLETLDKYL